MIHTWLSVSPDDPRPMYGQVIRQIRQRVAAGDLVPGTELPSIRQLAAQLSVSVITIKRAYLELERDGVIVTRHGKGSVIADQPGLQASMQESEFCDLMNQTVNLGRLMGKTLPQMQRQLKQIYEHPPTAQP